MPKPSPVKVGDVFGRLTVREGPIPKLTSGGVKYVYRWLCECDCEERTTRTVTTAYLTMGIATACVKCSQRRARRKNCCNLAGKKFGKLTVLRRLEEGLPWKWVCQCNCPNKKVVNVRTGHLTSGKTTSCGCICPEVRRRVNTTHGGCRTREYGIWRSIINRCTNPKNRSYNNYGGRGIKVCDRWLKSFENFREDVGECPPDLTLDRTDVNGHYEKSNCRWVDQQTQMLNRRITIRLPFRGRNLTLVEWAKVLKISYRILHRRYWRGWTVQDTLTVPENGNRANPTPKRMTPVEREKEKARVRCRNRIKGGHIVKPDGCQHPGCDRTDIQAHHHKGYEGENAFDVVWLCLEHHGLEKARKITAYGRVQTLRQWEEEFGVPTSTISNRIKHGWPTERAVSEPPRRKKQK